MDLVTEGAVTLNQVYNVLGEDLANLTEDSGVTELCALLHLADRVNITAGKAQNPASSDISFRQCGILTRDHIVPLLAEKLRAAGKLVVLDWEWANDEPPPRVPSFLLPRRGKHPWMLSMQIPGRFSSEFPDTSLRTVAHRSLAASHSRKWLGPTPEPPQKHSRE